LDNIQNAYAATALSHVTPNAGRSQRETASFVVFSVKIAVLVLPVYDWQELIPRNPPRVGQNNFIRAIEQFLGQRTKK